MRHFDDAAFDCAFAEICAMRWQEAHEYYPRYRSRYKAVMQKYARLAPGEQQDVLEIGGGQLAALAKKLWADRVVVADVVDNCFASLQAINVDHFIWNLAVDDTEGQYFDVIFCSEVIEHLPIPGHVALRRIYQRLQPGGCLILTTPNFYRLRNIVFLVAGRPIFDNFDLPRDSSFGHVLEYSREHLLWHFERAGFRDTEIEFVTFSHAPYRIFDRLLSFLGAPLPAIVPRFRDSLFAVARRPT